jgi:hypothetical protein
MKTWAAMYAIIWLSFFGILLVMFPLAPYWINITLHGVLGIGVLYLDYFVWRHVLKTSCPARIKRITKATFYFAVVQGLLGVVLVVGVSLSWGTLFSNVIGFFHVVVAITIITQASSSATAYDMWEEKEFQEAAPA